MSDPKIGLRFDNVLARVKRLEKDDRAGKVKDKLLKENLKKSLLNQCKLYEGDSAAKEIEKEISTFSGSSNRNRGFGEGIRGSSGRYVWNEITKEWTRE